ncbi:MAG: hypothetical protein J5958_06600 [Clostridia bacterium]|nr:hypothetical protein [Clostridia bacterium]
MMNMPFNPSMMMGQFRAFQQNPMAFLAQRRLNIPPALQNDPNAAIQYLMNSGQMTQEQYNQLRQMAQQYAPYFNGQR